MKSLLFVVGPLYVVALGLAWWFRLSANAVTYLVGLLVVIVASAVISHVFVKTHQRWTLAILTGIFAVAVIIFQVILAAPGVAAAMADNSARFLGDNSYLNLNQPVQNTLLGVALFAVSHWVALPKRPRKRTNLLPTT